MPDVANRRADAQRPAVLTSPFHRRRQQLLAAVTKVKPGGFIYGIFVL